MVGNIYNRIYDKVQYKFSLIFSAIYIVINNYKTFDLIIINYLILSIVLSIGVAGLGYVFNDYKDLKDDIKNNKRNIFKRLNKFTGSLVCLLFFILAALPWYYLPFNQVSFILLLIEIALLYIYAFPPFRLKERTFWGVLADSLYAQVFPCTLAMHTFNQIYEPTSEFSIWFIAIFIAWLFVIGVRNIMLHQIEDYDNDINTNTQTLVIEKGKTLTFSYINSYILPIEFILLFVLLLMFPHTKSILLPIFILIASGLYFINRKQLKNNLSYFINHRILNEFYEIYLPVFLLLIYIISNTKMIYLLIFHLILFSPIYFSYIKGFVSKYF